MIPSPAAPETHPPPLVTFFVTGYRQADTIAAALEGALAQTWRPLEVIFADDASPDDTAAIMEAVAAAHQGRRGMSVRVLRAPANGGIVANVNRVMAESRGDLVVMSGGDDVSLPHRTARLAAAWEASGRRAHLLHSAARVIDAEGRPTGARREGHPALLAATGPQAVLAGPRTALGATMAWSRALWDRFGPLPETALVEDPLLTLRAALIGPILYLDEDLVQWREGGVSWTPPRNSARERLYGAPLKFARWRAAACRALLDDLARVDRPDRDEIRALAAAQAAGLGLQVALADAGGPAGRAALAPRAFRAALAGRSSRPVKLLLHYLLGGPYMRWSDARHGVPPRPTPPPTEGATP